VSGCRHCTHSLHPGYECGQPITETIRDDVGFLARPTGIRKTLIVDTCGCTESEAERKQYLIIDEVGSAVTFTAAISKVVGDEIELTDVRDYRRVEKK